MGQTLLYGILNGALYGVIALGVALVFGVMRYLNLAHGSFIILGAYGSLILFRLGLDPFLSIPVVAGGLFLGGAILYRVCFAGLVGFPEGNKIKNSVLISFGLMLLFDSAATIVWRGEERSITPSYSGVTFDVVGLRVPLIGLAGALLAVVLAVALHLLLTRTYFGKAVTAVSQDPEAASLMGIDVNRTFLLSFALSVALASIPSVLIGLKSFSPTAGIRWFNQGLIVAMLSGMGNIYGVFPAGLFLGVAEALSVFVFGATYREVTGLAIFLLVMILFPGGVRGMRAAS